jgi:hypothetical protein
LQSLTLLRKTLPDLDEINSLRAALNLLDKRLQIARVNHLAAGFYLSIFLLLSPTLWMIFFLDGWMFLLLFSEKILEVNYRLIPAQFLGLQSQVI